jgi:hypothetical protein
MSSVYTVQKGDWLDKIARNHGFESWRDLYYHPENAAFRAKRPNPNLIHPGDQIVIPGVVTGVTASGATRIPADGNPNIIHFVTPKRASNVTLTATISPDTPALRGRITWEGATPVPGNPLQATVPRHLEAKHVVKIKVGGRVDVELRVWVIWATITVTDVPISVSDPENINAGRQGAIITGGFRFRHQIAPSSVITDTDRPNLRGANTVAPPGGNHPLFGVPLAAGANRKWDNTRQIRAKILNPAGISADNFLQPPAVNIPSYPANDVEGNDDRTPNEETNDPYANGGVLNGFDSPNDGVAHAGGADGDTYEYRLHFREFTRVELDGVWHRVSDFFPWRIHIKFRKVRGKWVDDSTEKATDNSGF